MKIQYLLHQLFISFVYLIYLILNPLVFIPVLIICFIKYKRHKEYTNCAYYKITKLPYRTIKKDSGRYGEYLTYKRLNDFEKKGSKFLFNLYIPMANDKTTEIDVLMISPKGLFAFESKNYSGWIFGSETQKYWYQTLPTGRGESHKEKFYNPVMQNRNHIKHLKSLIGENYPIHSIIVFSERCTLKDIQIKDTDIKVINRYDIASTVKYIYEQDSSDILSASDITSLYEELFKYTQVDTSIKEKHIEAIHNQLNSSSAPSISSTLESGAVEKSINIPSNETTTIAEPLPTKTESVLQENSSEPEQSSETESVTVQADSSNINTEVFSTNLISTEPTVNPSDTPQTKQLKCPRCGGNLIKRTATRGANAGNQFYGCSNFPRCRYIQNITKETV